MYVCTLWGRAGRPSSTEGHPTRDGSAASKPHRSDPWKKLGPQKTTETVAVSIVYGAQYIVHGIWCMVYDFKTHKDAWSVVW